VVQAAGHTSAHEGGVTIEVQELNPGRRRAQDVTIAPAQGRAASDATGLAVLGQPLTDRLKPRSAIVVVQGVTGRHLGDAGFVVKCVSVRVVEPKSSGEGGTDRRLTRSRHAHHHHQRPAAMKWVSHECSSVLRCAGPVGVGSMHHASLMI
jgi:hypothetical protein